MNNAAIVVININIAGINVKRIDLFLDNNQQVITKNAKAATS